MKPEYDHFRPLVPQHDKKARAQLAKNKVLNQETRLRLKEQNQFLNTEDHGYL